MENKIIRRNKITDISNDDLKKMLDESLSFREVLMKIGYNTNGSGGYSTLKNECKLRNITIPIYNQFGKSITGKIKKLDDDEIFCKNSTYSRQHLKERIIKNNFIEYKCSDCGNSGEWNGKKLVLQLEHKNGVNNDNRLENLTFLCPNCHTQTDTYSSKSRKKKTIKNEIFKTKNIKTKKCDCGKEKWLKSKKCITCYNNSKRKVKNIPPKEDLLNMIKESSMEAVGRKYGVTGNAVKKWLK